ncbi:uncharacterized protein LOC141912956 [Tubulanus polymorphus]|uniref:uncharacterized protein LOC141912956 n=1 Tax=Tubulanus polymorphus TaxID=672921 RepID=UPI003DA2DD0A
METVGNTTDSIQQVEESDTGKSPGILDDRGDEEASINDEMPIPTPANFILSHLHEMELKSSPSSPLENNASSDSADVVKKPGGRTRRKSSPDPNIPVMDYELQEGYRILKEMMAISNKTLNWPFIDPVDGQIYTDYYERITKPIWLNKMKEKFMNLEYQSIMEFVSDFRLMVENCNRYNGIDHPIAKKGQRFEVVLDQKLALLSRDLREKISAATQTNEEDTFTVNRRRGRLLMPHDSGAKLLQRREEALKREKEFRRQQLVERKNQYEQQTQELNEWDESLLSEENMAQMKAMWELPQIGLFLYLCSDALRVGEVPQYELERSLILPRESMMMRLIMTSLLRTVTQRIRDDKKPLFTYNQWMHKLRTKFEKWYRVLETNLRDIEKTTKTLGVEPRFFEVLGLENPLLSRRFHELNLYQRVWIVKSLCDHVLETQDGLRDAIEANPPADQREYYLGTDAQGNTYLHFPQFCGQDLRIYRQALIKLPEMDKPTTPVKPVRKRRRPASRKRKKKNSTPRSRPSRLRQVIKTVLKEASGSENEEENDDQSAADGGDEIESRRDDDDVTSVVSVSSHSSSSASRRKLSSRAAHQNRQMDISPNTTDLDDKNKSERSDSNKMELEDENKMTEVKDQSVVTGENNGEEKTTTENTIKPETDIKTELKPLPDTKPDLNAFVLYAESVDDLRKMVQEFSRPDSNGDDSENYETCVEELHDRLAYLLKELEPWEQKLLLANRRMKRKMKKEMEDWKEEPEQEIMEISSSSSSSDSSSDNDSSSTDTSSDERSNRRNRHRKTKKRKKKKRKRDRAADSDCEIIEDVSSRGRLRKRRKIERSESEDSVKSIASFGKKNSTASTTTTTTTMTSANSKKISTNILTEQLLDQFKLPANHILIETTQGLNIINYTLLKHPSVLNMKPKILKVGPLTSNAEATVAASGGTKPLKPSSTKPVCLTVTTTQTTPSNSNVTVFAPSTELRRQLLTPKSPYASTNKDCAVGSGSVSGGASKPIVPRLQTTVNDCSNKTTTSHVLQTQPKVNYPIKTVLPVPGKTSSCAGYAVVYNHTSTANVGGKTIVNASPMVTQTSAQTVSQTGQTGGQVLGQTGGQVLGQTGGQVLGQTGGQVLGQTGGQVLSQTVGQVLSQTVGQSSGQMVNKIIPAMTITAPLMTALTSPLMTASTSCLMTVSTSPLMTASTSHQMTVSTSPLMTASTSPQMTVSTDPLMTVSTTAATTAIMSSPSKNKSASMTVKSLLESRQNNTGAQPLQISLNNLESAPMKTAAGAPSMNTSLPTVTMKIPAPATMPLIQPKQVTHVTQAMKAPIPACGMPQQSKLITASTSIGSSLVPGSIMSQLPSTATTNPTTTTAKLNLTTDTLQAGNLAKLLQQSGHQNVVIRLVQQNAGGTQSIIQGFLTPKGLVIPQSQSVTNSTFSSATCTASNQTHFAGNNVVTAPPHFSSVHTVAKSPAAAAAAATVSSIPQQMVPLQMSSSQTAIKQIAEALAAQTSPVKTSFNRPLESQEPVIESVPSTTVHHHGSDNASADSIQPKITFKKQSQPQPVRKTIAENMMNTGIPVPRILTLPATGSIASTGQTTNVHTTTAQQNLQTLAAQIQQHVQIQQQNQQQQQQTTDLLKQVINNQTVLQTIQQQQPTLLHQNPVEVPAAAAAQILSTAQNQGLNTGNQSGQPAVLSGTLTNESPNIFMQLGSTQLQLPTVAQQPVLQATVKPTNQTAPILLQAQGGQKILVSPQQLVTLQQQGQRIVLAGGQVPILMPASTPKKTLPDGLVSSPSQTRNSSNPLLAVTSKSNSRSSKPDVSPSSSSAAGSNKIQAMKLKTMVLPSPEKIGEPQVIFTTNTTPVTTAGQTAAPAAAQNRRVTEKFTVQRLLEQRQQQQNTIKKEQSIDNKIVTTSSATKQTIKTPRTSSNTPKKRQMSSGVLSVAQNQTVSQLLSQQIGSPAVAQIGSPAVAQIGSPAVAQIGSPAVAQIGSPAVAQIGSPGLATVTQSMNPPQNKTIQVCTNETVSSQFIQSQLSQLTPAQQQQILQQIKSLQQQTTGQIVTTATTQQKLTATKLNNGQSNSSQGESPPQNKTAPTLSQRQLQTQQAALALQQLANQQPITASSHHGIQSNIYREQAIQDAHSLLQQYTQKDQQSIATSSATATVSVSSRNAIQTLQHLPQQTIQPITSLHQIQKSSLGGSGLTGDSTDLARQQEILQIKNQLMQQTEELQMQKQLIQQRERLQQQQQQQQQLVQTTENQLPKTPSSGGQKLVLYNINGQLVTAQGIPVCISQGVIKFLAPTQSSLGSVIQQPAAPAAAAVGGTSTGVLCGITTARNAASLAADSVNVAALTSMVKTSASTRSVTDTTTSLPPTGVAFNLNNLNS